MSLWNYGPEHWWFAWRPVWTDCGWRWLRRVRRRRVYVGPAVPGAADWWEYTLPVLSDPKEEHHD